MSEPEVAPYGTWRSPITADLIVSQTIVLSSPLIDRNDVYWLETRPSEGGRSVLVRRAADGTTTDVSPSGFNVRTRAHEYGGGAVLISDGTVYFSNFDDNRLYRQAGGSQPEPLTVAQAQRFADLQLDRWRNRLIAVREDHRESELHPANTLVAVDLAGEPNDGHILVQGSDFYASPRLSADGTRLAWLSWNQPNMPWDGCELWTARFEADGSLGNRQLVAGGADESIFQPVWGPDGALYFISDRTGWWNMYRLRDGEAQALYPMDAEWGLPQWVFGLTTYAWETTDRLLVVYSQGGTQHLARLYLESGDLEHIDTPYTTLSGPRTGNSSAVLVAGRPDQPTAIVRLDLASGSWETLRRSSETQIDAGFLSPPEAIEFPTDGGVTAHAFFYPPRNQHYRGPDDERAPLIVISHGGPTGATSAAFSLALQFWTSRGFGVVDVNNGGSTGYGRAYRRRLNGGWGIVDVNDCINAARFLVERGDADPQRLIIRGGSAGGYTTLAALAFRNTFRAGASYYGVSDIEALVRDCHKFEAQYEHSLIGPYPERSDLYRERSPIHYVDNIACPIILFQGLEDRVVPPNQSQMMYEAVVRRGVPAAYVEFAGEGHGFRRAENIKRSLENELYFYGRVFGFEPADELDEVPIANLPVSRNSDGS